MFDTKIETTDQILTIINSTVRRWHSSPSFKLQACGDETHAHQWRCAMLLLWLNHDATPEMMMEALTHDISETFVGDVPHHAKVKYPELREKLHQIEEDFLESLGIQPSHDRLVKAWVKLVDLLDAIIVILKYDPLYLKDDLAKLRSAINKVAYLQHPDDPVEQAHLTRELEEKTDELIAKIIA